MALYDMQRMPKVAPRAPATPPRTPGYTPFDPMRIALGLDQPKLLSQVPLMPPPGTPQETDAQRAQRLIDEWIKANSGEGSRGPSLADEMALARENARLAAESDAASNAFKAEQDRIQRSWDRDQAVLMAQDAARREEMQRQADREAQAANLQAQRQQTYVDLLGRDPARAILFALGYGPEHDVFSTQAKKLGITLPPLIGAAESQKTTQDALSKLLGAKVTIGEQGVQGLGQSPYGAARAFAQGGADAQKLLTSAYGVGSTAPGGMPGISPERFAEQLAQVTPQGNLPIA